MPRTPKRSRSRLLRSRFALALFAGTLVAAAIPQIASRTALRERLLLLFLPGGEGSVTVGEAHFAWLEPLVFDEVAIARPGAEPHVTCRRIVVGPNLWQLLSGRARTQVTLDHPHARLTSDESGRIDLVAELGKYWDRNGRGRRQGVEVTVTNAALTLINRSAGQADPRESRIDNIHVEFRRDGSQANIAADGRLAGGETTGTLQVKGAWQPEGSGSGDAPNSLHFVAENLPLGHVTPVLRSLLPLEQIAGTLDADLTAAWQSAAAAPRVELRGTAEARQLSIRAARWFGEDLFWTETLAAGGALAWSDHAVELSELEIDSDLGRLHANGTFELPQSLQASSQRTLAGRLWRHEFTVDGHIDLERLAAVLPRTLRLHRDLNVTSGEVTLSLRHARSDGVSVLSGRAECRKLAALRAGQWLSWEQPVALELRLRDTAEALVVDTFQCRSDLFDASITGTTREMTLSLQCELRRLRDELGKYLDLGNSKMAGRLAARTTIRQTDDAQLELSGDFEVTDPSWTLADDHEWRETKLSGRWQAVPDNSADEGPHLTSGELTLHVGNDRLRAALQAPLRLTRSQPRTAFALEAVGRFETWQARLRQLGWLPNDEATRARGELSVQLSVDRQASESQVAWNGQTRDLVIESAAPHQAAPASVQHWGTFASSGVARYSPRHDHLTLELLKLEGAAGTIQAAGTLTSLTDAPTADLRGIAVWDWEQLAGHMRAAIGSGIQFRGHQERHFVLKGPLPSARLVVGRQPAQNPASRPLARHGAPPMRPVSESRVVASPSTKWDISHALQGHTTAGWAGGGIWGIPLDSGEIDVVLENGVLHFRPRNVVVSGGRLATSASLPLHASPQVIHLSPGPAIQNAGFSGDLMRGMVRFIAPPLTGAVQVDGRFSVNLSVGQIPVDSPADSLVEGQLLVRGTQIRSGPLADGLAGVLGRIQGLIDGRPLGGGALQPSGGWITVENQNVDFKLVGRRVYHRQFQFRTGSMTVRTEGSVGLDQTLAMVALVQLEPRILKGNPLLLPLANSPIRIPIRGTLSNPDVQAHVLQDLLGPLLRTGANVGEAVIRPVEGLLSLPFGGSRRRPGGLFDGGVRHAHGMQPARR